MNQDTALTAERYTLLIESFIDHVVHLVQNDVTCSQHASKLSGVISIEIGTDKIGFAFDNGQITTSRGENVPRPTASIYFMDLETVLHILSGTADVNLCCVRGTFIIKGYLPLLAIFNPIMGKAFQLTMEGEAVQ
ncbi:hypothetical protein HUB98_02240 [Paenibacillus barcinonensis]|uniref:SCP-2 sterol transfer family protein n=1 Tax=Paenibacillus barcinonensis TaxID=198119 RepID=A0A2V4VT22_PAEBA|nr:hypothetical protein [Paenibacillus barcinonensis]PYE45428.1 hypothetical protein DFQ00_12046 [Paenibacillus barcinonensis]QKS55244.1 hypothetical protein HUB98_02240 [Paenibacillus barcinonensis]